VEILNEFFIIKSEKVNKVDLMVPIPNYSSTGTKLKGGKADPGS